MQNDAIKINTIIIENAIEELIKSQNGVFNVSDVIALLNIKDEEGKISERIFNSLQIDNKFFYDDETFYLKHKFFTGKSFVITPSQREIDDKILIPGHRFSAFLSQEIFPSEVTLIDKANNVNISTKVIKDTIEELFPYHALLGAEQISDFFIAENPKNANFRNMDREQTKLYLNVFDMKAFYKANNFQDGDALLCKIKNYNQGIVEFKYLSGEDRTTKNINKFIEAYNNSIFDVIEKFENYLELTEQLSWGFFLARKGQLFGSKVASLDEFIRKAQDLEIDIDNGHAILARVSAKNNADNFEPSPKNEEDDNSESKENLPEGFAISSGATDSLEEILSEIGSTLTLNEIDSYILDNYSMRNHDFSEFFNRAFNKANLNFADEAQEMIFLNYLDERFENLQSSYDIIADENKANLRGIILDITSARNEFFDNLKTIEFDEEKLPKDELKKISEATMHLNNILQLLNNFGYEITEDESSDMEKSIEEMEIIIEDAMESIESFISTNS